MPRLDEIADIFGGYSFKSSDLGSAGVAVVKIADINPPLVSLATCQRVSPSKAVGLSRYLLKDRDIVMAMTGATTGKVGRYRGVENAYLNQRVAKLAAKLGPEFDDYVYALVSQPGFEEKVLNNASGSAQPNVSAEGIGRIEVPALSRADQLSVGRIIAALDDKIELNRKMSATLEAIARALFKSWFVDFDPVRAKAEGRDPGLSAEIVALFPDSFDETAHGQIPSGWLTKSVADVATASRDTINPGKFPDELFEHYSIPAYDGGRGAKVERGESIKSHKFIVLQDAVLLSRLNPRTPRIWIPTSIGPRRAICSTEFAVLLPKPHSSREWLYYLFSNQTFCEHLTTMVTGTSGSHQRVRPESLLAMQTVAPAEPVVQIFTKIVRPFLTRVALARNESLTLAALRDALLPKLVSGELRVGEAKRVLAASA